MFAVQISIPYQYTSFWGSGIPIYLMFSENSSNIPIYRMHDLGAQKGHTNIPHVFEKWPNIRDLPHTLFGSLASNAAPIRYNLRIVTDIAIVGPRTLATAGA